MSVVGFDFGNETSVIAVAQRGGINVLQNSEGRRSTPTCVAFSEAARVYGSAATAQEGGNFKNTFSLMKQLLGKKFDDPCVAYERKFVSYDMVALPNGRIGVQVKGHVVPVEQLAGAYLSYLKQETEKALNGQSVVDCVLSCPADYSDGERRALLDAARLAGLNVLRLMNETTAVALNYGILRQLPADQKLTVLFYDLGYATTKASVVVFEQGKLEVMATHTDRTIGARDFDWLLMEHFAGYIRDKYKMDVLSNAKATLKLRKECQRVKKMLSANRDVPFNVEYIMNDTDVTGMITRDEFEALAAKSVLERITEPIRRVVEMSGVALTAFNSVEVVGGGVRVSMVQEAVKAYVGQPLSFTCDGDESVARGCVLQCAMLSPNFRVREFSVSDISPYPIKVIWGPEAEPFVAEDEAQMFAANHTIPMVKQISFKDRKTPLRIVASYDESPLLPAGTARELATFVVSDIPVVPVNAVGGPRMKIKVRVDINSLVSVSSAVVLQEVEVEEKIVKKKPPVVPVVPTPAPVVPETKTEEEVKATGDDAAADVVMDDASATATAAEAAPAAPATDGGDAMDGVEAVPSVDAALPAPAAAAPVVVVEEEVEVKMVKQTRRTNLTVVSAYTNGLSSDDYNTTHERETAWAADDRLVRETQERMNELETYVLEMRTELDGNFREFATDEAREAFMTALSATEEWLYDDGFEAQKSEFVRRLTELRNSGNPIVRRYADAQQRGTEFGVLKKLIGQYQVFVSSEEEKYAHVSAEDRGKVAARCQDDDTWLVTSQVALDRCPKYEDPSITCGVIQKRARDLRAFCDPIVNQAKPRPPSPPPAPAADTAAAPKTGDDAEEKAKKAKIDGDATAAGGGGAAAAEVDDVPMADAGATPMEVDDDDNTTATTD